MRWLIRITGGLLLLALVGVTYQHVGMALDRKQYGLPDKLIDVGWHQLHLYCTGKNVSPSI